MGSTYTNPTIRRLDEWEEQYKHLLLNKAIAYAHEAKAYQETIKAEENTLENLNTTSLKSQTLQDWSLFDATTNTIRTTIDNNISEGDHQQAKKLAISLDDLNRSKKRKDKIDNALNNMELIKAGLVKVDPIHNTGVGSDDDENTLPNVALSTIQTFRDVGMRAKAESSVKEIAAYHQQLKTLEMIKNAKVDSLATSFNPKDVYNAQKYTTAKVLLEGGQHEKANTVLSQIQKYDTPATLELGIDDDVFITSQKIETGPKNKKLRSKFKKYNLPSGDFWKEWDHTANDGEGDYVRTSMTDTKIAKMVRDQGLINQQEKNRNAIQGQNDHIYVGQMNQNIDALTKAGKKGLVKYTPFRKGDPVTPESNEARLTTDARNILTVIQRTDSGIFDWDNDRVEKAWDQYEEDGDPHKAVQVVLQELENDKDNYDRSYKGNKVEQMNHRQLLQQLVSHYTKTNPLGIDLSDENPNLPPTEQEVDSQSAILAEYLMAVSDKDPVKQKELLEKLRAFKSLGGLDYSNISLPTPQ